MTLMRNKKTVAVRPARTATTPYNPNAVRPAPREELMPIALASVAIAFLAFLVCASRGYLLLYGDAVAHLGIARRILDARWPGLAQLGGVWLPLPHLLMMPFVQNMQAWQNGTGGSWPSLASYVLSVVGCYKLSRYVLTEKWALAATAFYALNPNLLYLATTAMTEPLFLALFLWSTVLLLETLRAFQAKQTENASWYMLGSGVLTLLMVFTRYDGWILGAIVWLAIAIAYLRAAPAERRVTTLPFVLFTLISLAGPLLWFWYNAHYCGDWLDFMRGPYSAAAIEKKTSPPGSKHYRGWHNPGWSLLFYTRTSQVDAAFWETGFVVMAAALAGAWSLWKKKLDRAALLLWVPLPFYVYSISWGSVPIFIPQLYPHSYYNSRYGMEMLPALAICSIAAMGIFERRLREKKPKIASALLPITMVLILANMIGMIWKTPLVFKEGVVNSSTRVPFETAVAQQLEEMPKGVPILIDTSDHIGAVQQAGLPLKDLLSPGDSDSYQKALKDPARSAAFVVAMQGDPVAKAVAAHPEGLSETMVLCHTDQPCTRFYRSELYGK